MSGRRKDSPDGPGGPSDWEQNVERWRQNGVGHDEFIKLLADIVQINRNLLLSGDRPLIHHSLVEVLTSEQKDQIWQGLSKLGDDGGIETNLVYLRMKAMGLSDLLYEIRRVEPFDLSERYGDFTLYDFGSESLIFCGLDRLISASVVAKMSFANFGDPAHVDVKTLNRRRRRLAAEATKLTHLHGTSLPAAYDVVTRPNPFLPRSFPDAVRHETFVVMEYIPGPRVDRFVADARRAKRSCCHDKAILRCARAYLQLQLSLHERLGSMFFYTDIKPENSIVSDESVRIVDASGIMDVSDAGAGAAAHVSPLYLSAIDHVNWRMGNLVIDNGFVLRTLSRVVTILQSANAAVVGKDVRVTFDGHLAQLLDALNAPGAMLGAVSELVGQLISTIDCRHGTVSE